MRHTDELMGVRTKQAASTVDRSAELVELQKRMRAVQELANTAGWACFVEELRSDEQRVLSLLERSIDPTTLAKLTGSLLVLKSFVDWPNYVARELNAMTKELVKE